MSRQERIKGGEPIRYDVQKSGVNKTPEHPGYGEYTVFSPEKDPVRGTIILNPGFAEFTSSFKAFAREFVKKGYRVIINEHPKAGALSDAFLQTELDHAKESARTYWGRHGCSEKKLNMVLDSIQLATFREAYSYKIATEHSKEFMNDPSLPVHVLGHSHGGLYTPIAHLLWPEEFAGRSLTLINPAGLSGKIEDRPHSESPTVAAAESVREERVGKAREMFGSRIFRNTEISLRYLTAALTAAWKFKKPGILFDMLRYTLPRSSRIPLLGYIPILGAMIPGAQTQDEGAGMANTDLRPILSILNSADMHTTVMYDTKDGVFPARTIERNPPDAGLIKTEGFGHFGPVHSPKEYAEIILGRILMEPAKLKR